MSDKIKFSDRGINITLYKQPSSDRWSASFTFKGKQRRFSTHTKYEEAAKKYVYKVIDTLENCTETPITRQKSIKQHMMTFEELFQTFVDSKRSTKSINDKTASNYEISGRNLVKFFGNWIVETDFKHYGNDLYQHYLKWRTTEGKEQYQFQMKNNRLVRGRKLPDTLSNRTLNSECILLHTILNYGKTNLFLLNDYQIPTHSKSNLPEKADIKVPTRDEYIKIKKYFSDPKRGNRPDIVLWMRLGSNTGMRPAEINSLTVKDVDYKHNILHIRHRKRKNKEIRDSLDTSFPITNRIKEITDKILDLTQSARERSGSDLLFIHPKTGKPIGNFKRAWNGMLEKLDLDRDYTPKVIRKVFITKMVKQSSIPLAIVANLVGHSNTNTLQKHYLHLRPDDNKRALEYAYMEIENKKKNER